ncbi:MAG: hypothetical protein GY761_21470 [Hyphomicrobiales bacterium]|nr:hypothetical protein [Hyphomicrobiales bacterium]
MARSTKHGTPNPQKRYGHGILGDSIEGGALIAVMRNGSTIRYNLPKTEVFEDITPRLADLDGDGTSEIITIVSSLRLGASLGIFQIKITPLNARHKVPILVGLIAG